MKLLFIHESFGAQGGAETNILLTAQAIEKRGHAIALAHGAGTGRGEEQWAETFTQRYRSIRSALDAFKPDVIYVHKIDDLASLAESGVPVVRMVHDHDLYCMRSYKYHPVSRQICHRAFGPYCVFPCGASIARRPLRWVSYRAKKRELASNRRFQRMIVASEYMKAELLRNGFAADCIEVHPYPIPATPGASTFSDRNLILYTGQILRGKGVDVLLEALALVRAPFECVIIGDGSFRSHCEALSRRLGLGDRVKFAGFVPQAELPGYFREASLAVMSSVWPEPFGMAGIEALAQGVPVVAFDAGGICEWLRDGVNGYLVPWMDRAAFAGRVETLLRDKVLARRLGEAGRKLVTERYDFEKYITGLENIFANL